MRLIKVSNENNEMREMKIDLSTLYEGEDGNFYFWNEEEQRYYKLISDNKNAEIFKLVFDKKEGENNHKR